MCPDGAGSLRFYGKHLLDALGGRKVHGISQ
jgi:hypothetical protein